MNAENSDAIRIWAEAVDVNIPSAAAVFAGTEFMNYPPALKAFELSKRAEAKPFLVRCLSHENPLVVAYAFIALAFLDPELSKDYMRKLASDERRVRVGVHSFGTEESLGELIRMLPRSMCWPYDPETVFGGVDDEAAGNDEP